MNLFNLSGAETSIFHKIWVNSMAADTMAPSVARSSTTIVRIDIDYAVQGLV